MRVFTPFLCGIVFASTSIFAGNLSIELRTHIEALSRLDTNWSPFLSQKFYFKKISQITETLQKINSVSSDSLPKEIYLANQLFVNITDYLRSDSSRQDFLNFIEGYAGVLEQPNRFEDYDGNSMTHFWSLQGLLYLWGRSQGQLRSKDTQISMRVNAMNGELEILRNRFFYGASQAKLAALPPTAWQLAIEKFSSVSDSLTRIKLIPSDGKNIWSETVNGSIRLIVPAEIFSKIEPQDRFHWERVKSYLPKGTWVRFPQIALIQSFLEEGKKIPNTMANEPVEYSDGPGSAGKSISPAARQNRFCVVIAKILGRPKN